MVENTALIFNQLLLNPITHSADISKFLCTALDFKIIPGLYCFINTYHIQLGKQWQVSSLLVIHQFQNSFFFLSLYHTFFATMQFSKKNYLQIRGLTPSNLAISVEMKYFF